MKLQILSDGSMVLDGDAAGLAEFAKAMRVTTSVATTVATSVATSVTSSVDPMPKPKPAPKEARQKLNVKFETEAKLLLAISPDKPRTAEEISKVSGLGMTQVNNLLSRMYARVAVTHDGGDPKRWIRLVDPVFDVFDQPSAKAESTAASTAASTTSSTTSSTAASTTKSAPVAKGTNTKFILDLCTDWTRRTVIVSQATAAGLNANSIGVQLPILVDRGQLEGRTAENGRVEYRAKPVDHTTS